MRVLVIDDDEDVRQLVGRFLERRGHSVEARAGALGLPSRVGDWWRGAPAPDAIVLDMMMPAMSGDAALKLLARNETSRAIPVVLYSAVANEEGERVAKGHPRCAFVSKSDRLTALVETLEQLVATTTEVVAKRSR